MLGRYNSQGKFMEKPEQSKSVNDQAETMKWVKSQLELISQSIGPQTMIKIKKATTIKTLFSCLIDIIKSPERDFLKKSNEMLKKSEQWLKSKIEELKNSWDTACQQLQSAKKRLQDKQAQLFNARKFEIHTKRLIEQLNNEENSKANEIQKISRDMELALKQAAEKSRNLQQQIHKKDNKIAKLQHKLKEYVKQQPYKDPQKSAERSRSPSNIRDTARQLLTCESSARKFVIQLRNRIKQ